MKKSSNSIPEQDFAQIKSYLSGKMNSAESHAFEAKMLEDPFLRDAVEGYSEFPDWNWSEIKASKKSGLKWIYAVLSFGCISLLLWVFLKPAEDIQDNIASSGSGQAELIIQEAVEPPSFTVEEIRTSDSSVSVLVSDLKPAQPNAIPEKFIQELDPETLKPLTVLAAKKANSVPVPQNDDNKLKVKPSDQKIYHIRDYKVFDYRGLRFDLTEPELNLGGTPASGTENPDIQSAEVTKQVSYVKYLEQSIRLFSQAEYQSAAGYFHEILKKYPDDVNALFYGGLCDFYQANYSEAIIKFQKSGSHEVQLFADESQWYRARAMYHNNQKNEALVLMRNIASGGNFYKAQATEFLQSVKNEME